MKLGQNENLTVSVPFCISFIALHGKVLVLISTEKTKALHVHEIWGVCCLKEKLFILCLEKSSHTVLVGFKFLQGSARNETAAWGCRTPINYYTILFWVIWIKNFRRNWEHILNFVGFWRWCVTFIAPFGFGTLCIVQCSWVQQLKTSGRWQRLFCPQLRVGGTRRTELGTMSRELY